MKEYFKKKNIVLVGDANSGKTSFLYACLKNYFIQNYIPTAFDIINYIYDEFDIEFRDTAGQPDYNRLKHLVYPGADLILMFFSINSLESLENLLYKWNIEIKLFSQNTPIILIGTKIDLMRNVSMKDAQFAVKKINALMYLECSAKTFENIDKVFEIVINQVTKRIKKKKQIRECKII